MRLRMWTYDLAREQAPTLDHLRRFCNVTLESGYNALGLYLEHRFAYPCAPWSHGKGCVTPEMVQSLQDEFKELKLIPFLNLLGHMEGMLYTEFGRRYAEGKFHGMQACPSRPETTLLALNIIEDALKIFTSDIIHLGGDETWQLAQCPLCSERELSRYKPSENSVRAYLAGYYAQDQKASLYSEYFTPLIERVKNEGRRAALWGDMLLEHDQAADELQKDTLIFDWQYFSGPARSSRKLQEHGFEVVCCPTLQTYNAEWFHLTQSEANVRAHARQAVEIGAYGLCLTTWENGLFGNYETLLPAVRATGEIFRNLPEPPAKDDTAELVALAEGKTFQINPRGELLEAAMAEDEVQAPIIKLANALIEQALRDKARFVRIEPTAEMVDVYYDDLAEPYRAMRIPKQLEDNLLGRLRLLAGMRVAARRLAQEGIIDGVFMGEVFEFRCRTKPDANTVRFLMARPSMRVEEEDNGAESDFLKAFQAEGEDVGRWARLLGVDLPSLGGVFAHSGTRSSLKVRLLLQSNPFLAWLHHGDELAGEIGEKALALVEEAMAMAPNASYRGVAQFVKGAVEFVRYAEQAHLAYAAELPGVAVSSLTPCRQIFEDLAKVAQASHLNIGGSLADIERCQVARNHVETVMLRIKSYGDGSLGYLPSFEHLTHPKFMPHDQAAWWLINRWANE